MSDLLKHVIVGDLIGEQCHRFRLSDSGRRWLAFGGGFASHIVLDLIDVDYTINWFNPIQLRAACPFVIAQAAGILLVLIIALRDTKIRPSRGQLRLWAIAGSVAPDVIDGFYSVLNPQVWYTGQLLLPFHRTRGPIQRMGMWPTLGITLLIMLLRYGTIPFYLLVRRKVLTFGRGVQVAKLHDFDEDASGAVQSAGDDYSERKFGSATPAEEDGDTDASDPDGS